MPDVLGDKYIGTVLEDRYEIMEKIGEGGMALVYKAKCNKLNRLVAIKIMKDDVAQNEDFRSRFCTEAHMVALLSHPNIVSVFDVSHNDELEYLVMELIDGITLKQYLDVKGILPYKEAVYFAKQVCKALLHAHERGIIHRDIKPHNIMLLRDGTVKVTDFGIAALENEYDELPGEINEALGSVHYISPEQAKNESVDGRSDLYSLGISMYEMLTGTLPFTGETNKEIILKHIVGNCVPISDINPEVPEVLEDIVNKLMDFDPEMRYQTAGELLNELNDFSDSLNKKNSPVSQEVIDEQETKEIKVAPVKTKREMSKNKYKQRRRASSRVTFFSGLLMSSVVCLALFTFVWKFWLADIFMPVSRIELPSFVGRNCTDLLKDPEYSGVYNFNISYVVNVDLETGTVISQRPVSGRNLMVLPQGINIDLKVATGKSLNTIPDLYNIDYREAQLQLQQQGFLVEIETATSSEVERDRVISSSPASGEKLSIGSTVYLTISSGFKENYTTMPNLIGYSESAAIQKIESCNLSYGGSESVPSDLEVGTVLSQSYAAYTDVAEYTKIYLRISSGSEIG